METAHAVLGPHLPRKEPSEMLLLLLNTLFLLFSLTVFFLARCNLLESFQDTNISSKEFVHTSKDKVVFCLALSYLVKSL